MLTEGEVPGQVLGRPGAGGVSREYLKIWISKRAIRASKGPTQP